MSYKPRKCRLQNYKTGQIIEADSICEFCRQAKLIGNDKYHITPILDRKPTPKGEIRFHHKGWHIPIDKDVKHELEDIYGNSYNVNNWIKFAKENNIHVTKFYSLLIGEIDNLRGLFLKKNKPSFKKPEYYETEIKKGNSIIRNRNHAKIGRIIKKSPWSLYLLRDGKLSNLNGWKLNRIIVKEKRGRKFKNG